MQDASQQLKEHLHTYGIQKFDSVRELQDWGGLHRLSNLKRETMPDRDR